MINVYNNYQNTHLSTVLAETDNTPGTEETKVLKILMVEDNEDDAALISMYLKSNALQFYATVVCCKEEYINALEQQEFDVILSDHNLPQFSSFEALKIRNEKKFHVPFILISGTIPEEYAVKLLQAGANDYILKDRLQRLLSAITEAIKKQKAVADKIIAEQELIKSELRYRSFFE